MGVVVFESLWVVFCPTLGFPSSSTICWTLSGLAWMCTSKFRHLDSFMYRSGTSHDHLHCLSGAVAHHLLHKWIGSSTLIIPARPILNLRLSWHLGWCGDPDPSMLSPPACICVFVLPPSLVCVASAHFLFPSMKQGGPTTFGREWIVDPPILSNTTPRTAWRMEPLPMHVGRD